MIKLIKLEYKKHKIGKYIMIALIIIAALTLFSFAQTYLGIARDSDTGVVDADSAAMGVSSYVDLFSTIAFLVLSSAMHAAFVVEEYKNKTIDLMFQYPIQRRKIIISKIVAVLFFNTIATVLCKLIMYGAIYIGSFSLTPDFVLDGIDLLSLAFYIRILLQSLTVVFLSIIALYIGLLMKSPKATIIASFMLVLLTQASIGSISLSNSALTSAILIAISIGCAFLCVARIDTKDVSRG